MKATKELHITASNNPTPKFKIGDKVVDKDIEVVFEIIGVANDEGGSFQYNVRFVWDKLCREEDLNLVHPSYLVLDETVSHNGLEWKVDACYESLSQYHLVREEDGKKHGLWVSKLSYL